MLTLPKNLADRDLLVDSEESAAELRAQRVWRYEVVMWLMWGLFGLFYWCRGHHGAGLICAMESIAHATLVFGFRNSKRYGTILNSSICISIIGLFTITAFFPPLADSIWFLPISIVIAYQLLGIRAACFWLLVTVLFLFSLYVIRNGSFASASVEQLAISLGVPVCLFFCCQQGEYFYQQRTKNLFQLSQVLQEKAQHLERLATTDELTGLNNRFKFKEDLRKAVERSEATSQSMVLFVVDMDGFKEINDTLGHGVGDVALIEISRRLKQFSDVASVSRLGGDEFCLIFSDMGDESTAEQIAGEVREVLTHRYKLPEGEFQLGASVGFAFYPEHTTSEEELLTFADTAMYAAKEKGVGTTCYQPHMTDRLVERRDMLERLSVAQQREEYFLDYQPQVDLRTGVVNGVEALLRWKRDGEVIPPFRFIPLLEECEKIIPVSKWVLREACRQMAAWHSEGHDIEMSVNVSAVQFEDPNFCDSVRDCLREFNVDPTKLDLEITEGLLIDDVPAAIEKLNRIKAMGVRLSIDDFGTGYSSLSYLRQFPLDRLKIDRSFIMDIPGQDDGAIAASIIVLSKTLGLKVIAEGVETVEQLEFLRSHDCDEYQGYYLSKPVTPDEVEKLFSRRFEDALA